MHIVYRPSLSRPGLAVEHIHGASVFLKRGEIVSKATIEDKLIVMDGFLRLGSKSITVDDYDGLRELLGAAVADWSLTRLRRTVGSLHHNDRVIRIARKGEPMRDMYRPYVFLVTGRLKLKELALTAR